VPSTVYTFILHQNKNRKFYYNIQKQLFELDFTKKNLKINGFRHDRELT